MYNNIKIHTCIYTWLFLVCSLTRKQLHDISHLAKAVTLVKGCHAMALHGICHAMACHGMSCHFVPSHDIACRAMSWHAMPWHAKSCHGMACFRVACHGMASCPLPSSAWQMSCAGLGKRNTIAAQTRHGYTYTYIYMYCL